MRKTCLALIFLAVAATVLSAASTHAAMRYQPTWGMKTPAHTLGQPHLIIAIQGFPGTSLYWDGHRYWAATPNGWSIYFKEKGHGWSAHRQRDNQLLGEYTLRGGEVRYVGNGWYEQWGEVEFPDGSRKGFSVRWRQ